ncbi:MAG: Esa1p-associated factor [Ramalina farinacea]|uniref:Chromatin modification-related protein EAF3 n=1 Tax=Ramalina farinacea TaxID=258253 RepID=A0AA43QUR4_9LECA|nr:Esa1p-associated factor [Ramalina farinacea]
MAPARKANAFEKDEKVLCFHHELLYEAKVLNWRHVDASDKNSPQQYRVHYKGWKATWDDWVPADRVRKFTDENCQLARSLKGQMDDLRRATTGVPKPTTAASAAKKKAVDSDMSSQRGSEDRQVQTTTATGRGQKRGREGEVEKEDSFLSRPAIRLPLPDHLKSILVDDWEYVTKSLSLVPLPSPHPVNSILDTYFDETKGHRRLGSAEADLLEEVVMGMKDYFEQCLGRILLYRFERQQYYEVRAGMDRGGGEFEGRKGVGDVYGAEHLCRLFVSLPELIAQTNMDAQSVKKLKEEITALTNWMAKNSARFMTQAYQVANPEYVDAAKGL